MEFLLTGLFYGTVCSESEAHQLTHVVSVGCHYKDNSTHFTSSYVVIVPQGGSRNEIRHHSTASAATNNFAKLKVSSLFLALGKIGVCSLVLAELSWVNT